MIKSRTSLADRIPIYKIEDGCLVTKTSCVAKVFELEMPEQYNVSQEEIDGFQKLFHRIIKSCPDNYIIHKQDYFKEDSYTSNVEGDSFLTGCFERKFQGREYFGHRAYLIIINYPKGQRIERIGSSLVRGGLVPKEISSGKEDFLNTVAKVRHALKSSGVKSKLLNSDGLAVFLEHYFNFGGSRILNDLVIKNDSIRHGSDEVLFYSTISSEIDIPKELDPSRNSDQQFDYSFTYPISMGLRHRHVVNTIIKKGDTTAIISGLKNDRERIFSFSKKSLENQNLVKEYDTFLNEQVKENKTPVHLHQNIMVWGSEAELRKCENEISNALMRMDIFARRNIDVANLFWACCPGNAVELPPSEFQLQFAGAASMYFPVESNSRNDVKGGIKLGERAFGVPITIDLWEEPMSSGKVNNRNMFILGPSGSGKSFTVNTIARQWYEQGYHITIIDVGGSYEQLNRYCGGQYFQYSKENKMSFNPFYYKGEKSEEEYENIKTLIVTLWKEQGAELKNAEETVLSKSVKLYFEYVGKEKIHSNFNAYYRFMMDVYRDGLTENEIMLFDYRTFEVVMSRFYEGGEFDYLLNSDDEFSISDLQFCVFELDEIKDHPVIFPIVTLVIMDAFITKMRNLKDIRKVILIEEAWKAISNPRMAEFLKYLFKTVRKHNGAVGVITQEIDDIVDNALIKDSIINNADTVILCDQSKYKHRFGEVEALLGLPKSEVKKIMSINGKQRLVEKYKEVYIKQGHTGRVLEVNVSREEALCYSTEASETVLLKKYIREKGSVEAGIEYYISLEKEKV